MRIFIALCVLLFSVGCVGETGLNRLSYGEIERAGPVQTGANVQGFDFGSFKYTVSDAAKTCEWEINWKNKTDWHLMCRVVPTLTIREEKYGKILWTSGENEGKSFWTEPNSEGTASGVIAIPQAFWGKKLELVGKRTRGDLPILEVYPAAAEGELRSVSRH